MGIRGDPFDLVVEEEKANELFLKLVRLPGNAPARAVIRELLSRFTDKDGNFLEQFQTAGFSPRLWELYLFAVLEEAGFELDWTQHAPDFIGTRDGVAICIEAATANQGPNDGQPPEYERDASGAVTMASFRAVTDYLAIKFGSPLFTKLNKRYWESEYVREKPLVLAVSDFTDGASMASSGYALSEYVYGVYHHWKIDASGQLLMAPVDIKLHKREAKSVPSGFFRLPGAENIAAVASSPAGTIAKFNRIGFERHLQPNGLSLLRQGTKYRHDKTATVPESFEYFVGKTDYRETWIESLSFFHNPNALHPLDHELFPGAAHCCLTPEGLVASKVPPFHTLGSRTYVIMSS